MQNLLDRRLRLLLDHGLCPLIDRELCSLIDHELCSLIDKRFRFELPERNRGQTLKIRAIPKSVILLGVMPKDNSHHNG